jgi:hypothetical protein
MSFVIDEARIETLLSECVKQQYDIKGCEILTVKASEGFEHPIFPSNIGSTTSQLSPPISSEETRTRLLLLRNRIVESGATLLNEEQLQQQIDEMKGRG